MVRDCASWPREKRSCDALRESYNSSSEVRQTLSRHKESEGREQVCVRQRRRERERGGVRWVQEVTEKEPTFKPPTLQRDQQGMETERRGRGRAGRREGENSR
jgi:hypothetical protein